MKNFFEMWKIVEQAPMVPQAPMAPQAAQQTSVQQQKTQPQQANQAPQQANQAPQQANQAPQQANQAQNLNKSTVQNKQNQEPVKTIENLLGAQYEAFVKILDKNINDPKFKAAMEYLIKNSGGKVPPPNSPKAYPVKDMRPTQNEVVLANSLAYPLENSDSAKQILFSTGGITLNGPIVTCNGGQFIIDGHHRWSQVYCVNPNAQIMSLDIGDLGVDPIETLKAVQIAIAVSAGDVPFAKGGGINLFEINEETLKGYVRPRVASNEEIKKAFLDFLSNGAAGTMGQKWQQEAPQREELEKQKQQQFQQQKQQQFGTAPQKQTTMFGDNQQQEWIKLFISMLNEEEVQNFQKPGTAEYQANDPKQSTMFQQGQAFADQDVEKVADYIWQNVQSLQTSNKPVANAPIRNFMPQTDNAPQWKDNLAKPDVIKKAAQAASQKNMGVGTVFPSKAPLNPMPQNMPLKQNASVEHEQPSLNEWLILSGVKKNEE